MKILAIYDKSGPKYHRILMPVHFMDYEVQVAYNPTDEHLEWCDIVFFNRLIPNTDILELVKKRKRYGFKLVCDLDDHWVLGRDHILYATYKKYNISDVIEQYIRHADAVTVTHGLLASEVKPLNKNVHVFENAIPKADQFLQVKIPDDYTRIFWAGGVTHRRDLQLLKRPFELLDRRNIKFILAGFSKNNPEWQAMANMYTNEGRWEHQVIEELGVHEYYKTYAYCDIAVIPLLSTPFNACKSNLKILEAANMEAPVVVSEVDPYLNFPRNVVNYVNSHATFYSNITKLMKDKYLMREQGIELRAYCDEHYNFNKINEQRKQLFDATIEHRPARKTPTEAY